MSGSNYEKYVYSTKNTSSLDYWIIYASNRNYFIELSDIYIATYGSNSRRVNHRTPRISGLAKYLPQTIDIFIDLKHA